VENSQLATGDPLDLTISSDVVVAEQSLRPLVPEAPNHDLRLFRVSEFVNSNSWTERVRYHLTASGPLSREDTVPRNRCRATVG
jgi:hypothetical protein